MKNQKLRLQIIEQMMNQNRQLRNRIVGKLPLFSSGITQNKDFNTYELDLIKRVKSQK